MENKKTKILGKIEVRMPKFTFEVYGVGKPIGAGRMRQIFRAWLAKEHPQGLKRAGRARPEATYAQALASSLNQPPRAGKA
jgi:hypothetical protein